MCKWIDWKKNIQWYTKAIKKNQPFEHETKWKKKMKPWDFWLYVNYHLICKIHKRLVFPPSNCFKYSKMHAAPLTYLINKDLRFFTVNAKKENKFWLPMCEFLWTNCEHFKKEKENVSTWAVARVYFKIVY